MTKYVCQKCGHMSDEPGKHCKRNLRKMTKEEVAELKAKQQETAKESPSE